ncbi:MAG: hypothetical protein K8U03_08330 [Planctomycetia bacterium]|nr:hypothetical protein [Planctomycetia bacterium]
MFRKYAQLLIVVALFWVCLRGCFLDETPVHLVIPNGFTGDIKIILDPARGQRIHVKDGRFTYAIQADGTLRVKSLQPFHEWHKQTASYEDGTSIQNGFPMGRGFTEEQLKADKGEIFYIDGGFTLGNNHTKTIHGYVGTMLGYEKKLRGENPAISQKDRTSNEMVTPSLNMDK